MQNVFDTKGRSKIAILVPHPDDEVIGCYYFICNYGYRSDIDLIYVTGEDDKDRAKVRQSEALLATENLIINNRIIWNLTDGRLDTTREKLRPLLKEVGEFYDYIFSPATNDLTPDHSVIAEEALTVIPIDKLIWYRSTWWTFALPSADFVIVGSKKEKQKSLRCFQTQEKLALQNVMSFSSLEAQRYGFSAEYVEAFQYANTERLANMPLNVLSLRSLFRIWKWQ